MNKLEYSLSELVSSLQAMEGIVTGGHAILNLKKASTSRPRPKGKGSRKKKDSKVQVGGPNPTVGKKAKKGKKRNNGKQKGKCFHCGVPGHWKRNCPDYLATGNQGMIESHVIEVSFLTDTSNS